MKLVHPFPFGATHISASSLLVANPRAIASALEACRDKAVAWRFVMTRPSASARLPEKTRDRNGARLPRARENRAGIVSLAVWATTSSIQPSTSLAPGSSKSSHSPWLG